MNKIKLFCFPFAGGSAAAFNPFKTQLDPSIQLQPIELAGRGRRIREPLYNSISEIVEDMFKIIRPELSPGPYAFFGHSMGSVVAFELTYKIRQEGLPEPVHIFFSGRGAPHMPRDEKKKYHLMSDEEFKQEMIELGGTSREFFEHPELMEVFLPLLRGDLKVNETYQYSEKKAKLDSPITVFHGKKDEEVTMEEISEWSVHTNRGCDINVFEGGHFFLNEEAPVISKIINRALIGASQ